MEAHLLVVGAKVVAEGREIHNVRRERPRVEFLDALLEFLYEGLAGRWDILLK